MFDPLSLLLTRNLSHLGIWNFFDFQSITSPNQYRQEVSRWLYFPCRTKVGVPFLSHYDFFCSVTELRSRLEVPVPWRTLSLNMTAFEAFDAFPDPVDDDQTMAVLAMKGSVRVGCFLLLAHSAPLFLRTCASPPTPTDGVARIFSLTLCCGRESNSSRLCCTSLSDP